jgi:hypothetical protein
MSMVRATASLRDASDGRVVSRMDGRMRIAFKDSTIHLVPMVATATPNALGQVMDLVVKSRNEMGPAYCLVGLPPRSSHQAELGIETRLR